MEQDTDLSKYIKTSESSESFESSESETSLKKVPSLPQLKPHFIVKEYCGNPRRESQILFLENSVKRDGSILTDEIDKIDCEKQKIKLPGGLIEKVALFGGAVVGGMIGLYVYGKAGRE